ncbi:hypothetical protein ACFLIM_16525 [Nonomuraea sp. M3C6]|uniref:Uncharacterized protein n=1 Tax=Nonomuraea marmarensis TaxID=3351344 RepID=A0ABW7ABS5_9ACTN
MITGGTVHDTVRNGASGVALAHYRVTTYQESCEEVDGFPMCHIETDVQESEPEPAVGRVSTGVGTSKPITPWPVPAPGPPAWVQVGLWVRVCTIDFSEGGVRRACSGLG